MQIICMFCNKYCQFLNKKQMINTICKIWIQYEDTKLYPVQFVFNIYIFLTTNTY